MVTAEPTAAAPRDEIALATRTPPVARLAAWVFGAAPRAERSWLSVAVPVLMVIAGTAIVFLRLPEFARNLLWAEDGAVFLTEAYTGGLVENLFSPYAGYMHLYPRIAAEAVASIVPVDYAGVGMNIIGALAWSTAAVAAYAFSRNRLVFPVRLILWAGVLLLPVGSLEVATNVANAHWFLIFGAFWAMTSRHNGVLSTAAASTIAAVAMLSDPLALVLAPMVLARIGLLRTWRDNIVSISFLAASAIQLAIVASTSRERSGITPSLTELFEVYVQRVVWGGFFGPTWSEQLGSAIGTSAVVTIASAALAVVAILLAIRIKSSGLGVTALIVSLGFFGVVHTLTWAGTGGFLPGQQFVWGGRYLVIPILLLLTAVLVIVDGLLARYRGSARSGTVVASVVFAVVAAAVIAPGVKDYSSSTYKTGSIPFEDGLVSARDYCESGVPVEATVMVGPPSFSVVIPCEVLDE